MAYQDTEEYKLLTKEIKLKNPLDKATIKFVERKEIMKDPEDNKWKTAFILMVWVVVIIVAVVVYLSI
jgi:hypothetical protein